MIALAVVMLEKAVQLGDRLGQMTPGTAWGLLNMALPKASSVFEQGVHSELPQLRKERRERLVEARGTSSHLGAEEEELDWNVLRLSLRLRLLGRRMRERRSAEPEDLV